MRRDYLIAILLAIAAVPAGATLMVAPEYLHLTGLAISLTFWGGIGLTLLLFATAAIVALHGAAESQQEASTMTPGDIGFNGAIMAAIIATIAAFWRGRSIAIIAAIIACGAVGFDFWYGPPRTLIGLESQSKLIGADLLRSGLQGTPLGWSRLYINNTIISSPGKLMNITNLSIMGGNVGSEEIKLDDAYFISGITGVRLEAKIGWGSDRYKIQVINPVPPNAFLFVLSDPGPLNTGLTQDDFLNAWSIIYFVVKYNGITQRVAFDRDTVRSMLPKPMEPFPHITPRKP